MHTLRRGHSSGHGALQQAHRLVRDAPQTKEPAVAESEKRTGIVFVLANGCQARFLGGCVIQNKMELPCFCWTASAFSLGAFFCSQLAGEWLISARDGDAARVQKFFQTPVLGLVSCPAERFRTCPPGTTVGMYACVLEIAEPTIT